MPAGAHLRRIARPLAALAAAGTVGLSVGGCGALAPEAPVAQASTISSALTTIIADCGESYRDQAFTNHPDLSSLDSDASSSAGKLAMIARRHPSWVYQGKTLAQIDTLSVQSLQSCSLRRAAALLMRAPQKQS